MSEDFHMGLPWSQDNFPLDTISYDTALEQLLRAGVVTEDGLIDYGLSQALRGLCFAVKSVSRPLKLGLTSHPISTAPFGTQLANAAWVRGCEAVFDIMCKSALVDPRYFPTVSYLSKRLLCDESSSYGEGNERPSCTTEWTQVLLLESPITTTKEVNSAAPVRRNVQYGTESYFSSRFNIDRRVQLGYLWMLTGTLRSVATESVQGPHLFTDHLMLVSGIVNSVLPRISKLADTKEQVSSLATSVIHRDAAIAEGDLNPLMLSGVPCELPSRLTLEANHFVIHTVHWLCTDVLAVYQSLRGGNQPMRKVLDRDAPLMLWRTVTLVRNALRRGLSWIQSEVESVWLKEEASSGAKMTTALLSQPVKADKKALLSVSEPIASSASLARYGSAECAFLKQVSHHLETLITNVLKTQEELDCARMAAAKSYGETSKDYTQLSEVMWANTIHLCLMLQGFTRSWMVIHGGLGISTVDAGSVLESSKDIVRYIGSCVTLIPSLEDNKKGTTHMAQASHSLLAALIALAAAAPLRHMQASLWISDPDCTRQIHGVLVQRALRAHNDQVQQMAALLAGSILHSTTTDLSMQLTSEVSNQLLDVLSESRDAASHYAIEMLTVAVVQKPHTLIPSLFRLLEHGNPQTRRNVLDVLAALPKLSASRPLGALSDEKSSGGHDLVDLSTPVIVPPPTEANMREVLRLLSENLLAQLHDEELLIRMQSAALFGKVWPEDVLEPLLNLFLKTDSTGRRQAAVKSSLQAVLQAHLDDAGVVLVLMQEAFRAIQGDGADVKAQSPSMAAPRKERVPATPGDILTHALLYTSAGPDEETTGRDDTAEKERPAALDAASDGFPQALTAATTRKGRIEALVKDLYQGWAMAVKTWSSEAHLEPLLRFLHTVPAALPEAQKWYLGRVMALFAYLTARRKVSDEDAIFPNHIMLQAIHNVYFSVTCDEQSGENLLENEKNNDKGNNPSTPSEREVSWINLVKSYARTKLEGNSNAAPQASDTDYQMLLPLLFLSSCPRGLFAIPSNSSKSCSEREGPNRSSQGNLVQTISSKVWRTLWTALTDQTCLQFWEEDRNVIHLLLRVMCNYPATKFFHQLEVKMESSNARTRHFLSRVFTFCMCHYSNNFVASMTSRRSSLGKGNSMSKEKNKPDEFQDQKDGVVDEEEIVRDDMKACLDSVENLNSIFRTFVLQWMIQKSVVPQEISNYDSESSVNQRLYFSAMDAWGLLTLVYLLDKDLAGKAWPLCAAYTRDPLNELADWYRHEAQEIAHEKVKNSALPGHVTAAQVDSIQSKKCLTFVCIQISSRTLEYLYTSHNISRTLILSWFECYLRPLIELANAVCASQQRGAASHYVEAFECAKLVCKAAIITAKYFKNASFPSQKRKVGFTKPVSTSLSGDSGCYESSQTSEGAFASFLGQLPLLDREALPNFALGCVRFKRSSEIQSVGVRLLSLLVSEAPEMLVSTRGDGDSNLLVATELALREFAFIHPDKQTRELAELALNTFAGWRTL